MSNILIGLSFLILVIFIGAFLAFMCIYTIKKEEREERSDIFNRYGELLGILEASEKTAYNKIFRDHILVQNASGFRMNKADLINLQKDYVHLTHKVCGPLVMSELERLHGSMDSISAMLITNFFKRVEDDEVTLFNKDDQMSLKKTTGE